MGIHNAENKSKSENDVATQLFGEDSWTRGQQQQHGARADAECQCAEADAAETEALSTETLSAAPTALRAARCAFRNNSAPDGGAVFVAPSDEMNASGDPREVARAAVVDVQDLSLIHISEPTRPY